MKVVLPSPLFPQNGEVLVINSVLFSGPVGDSSAGISALAVPLAGLLPFGASGFRWNLGGGPGKLSPPTRFC